MSDVVSDAGSRGSTSRKRKTADAAVDSGITALIGASEESDIAFIVKGLRESPEIIPVMAGMVRDGVLQKSLAHRASQKQAPQDIGKKMSIGLKTWGKLGIRFLQKFLKQLPSVDLALADDDNTMSFVDLQGLIFYALSVQASTKLPIQHAMAGYEGPLISVMNVQYETMGNRLAGLTRDNVSEYVYFKWSVERPTEVIYHLQNLTMQLPFDSGFMLGVHDWALVKNTTHEAQLVRSLLPSTSSCSRRRTLPSPTRCCQTTKRPSNTLLLSLRQRFQARLQQLCQWPQVLLQPRFLSKPPGSLL